MNDLKAVTPRVASKTKRLKWDQQKAANYSNLISNELRDIGSNPTTTTLTSIIKNVGKNLEMEKQFYLGPPIRRNPWFNSNCNEKKKIMRKAAKALKIKNLSQEKLTQYKDAK